ncbi:MAG: hypothetical protein JWM20_905 [Patescibacteria group bacterium]|nr:hypothetical protein [Patescibacteria group bacterium]
MMKHMPNINVTPFLWFNDNAEEAVNLYMSLFPNSKLVSIAKYPDTFPSPSMAGKVLTAVFELNGREFRAMDAGPHAEFTDAISLQVDVDTQEEVDHLWNGLTANGGAESRCGWCKDKFGVSWQIIPRMLPKLIGDSDREKSARAMAAMMTMGKIDIAKIQAAYDGQ